MANFDTLRSAIIGPLEYICRPKEKPSALAALYPFNGTLEDISNYHRDLSGTVTYEQQGVWNMVNGNLTISLGTLAEYTIDCFVYIKSLNMVNQATSQNWVMRSVTTDKPYFRIATGQGWNSIWWKEADVGEIIHVAVAQKSGVLYGWFNGVFKGSYGTSLTPLTSVTLLTNGSFCNLRVVSKCLQTSGNFPVPATYYTGYEAL